MDLERCCSARRPWRNAPNNPRPDTTHCSSSSRFRTYSLIAIVGLLLCAFSPRPTTGEPREKNVLIVFNNTEYSKWFLGLIEPLIRARVPGPINFHDAYLDDPQVEQKPYRENLAETFRQRYAGVKMDVVIACNPGGLAFTTEYRDKIFPGTPIVFVGVSDAEAESVGISEGITGVTTRLGFRETIDLILRLQPDTKAIAVVAGQTRWDKRFLEVAHSEILRYQNLEAIDVVAAVNDTRALGRINALPPHTVALFQAYPQYSSRPDFGTWDLLSEVARRVPTYSTFVRLCVNGCIGGAYEDGDKQVLLTGGLAAAVLNGKRAEDIPIVRSTGLRTQVDWQALRHWHIADTSLPSGSLILNRPRSAWERYRTYIIAAIVLVVVQFLLIAGLLWQRARKRKTEADLRESEERFRVMADTTASLIWMCDAQGKVTYLNDRRLAFTGADQKPGFDDAWGAYVHSDDVKTVFDNVAEALNSRTSFSQEYRLRRWDGTYRWMFDVASPRQNGDGSFAGFIGSAVDMTDQKLAQGALEKISGQLIEAQEKERRRIARELHDDISQKLALLSVELVNTSECSDDLSEGTKESLQAIQQRCEEIAQDVQHLSHELHSSKLDILGMLAAIRGFCAELAKKHGVRVKFQQENVPKHLPRDISLCLFRVTQEALHNALKYSGAKEFDVHVNCTKREVQLMIVDAGAGFDVDAAKRHSGLGLMSMQERMNLVNGRFSVESRPGHGTTVFASAPLDQSGASSADESAGAA